MCIRLHRAQPLLHLIVWHFQVQQIIAEQDAGLTQLGHSVRLLGDMGKDISVELGQQQRIIEEFDTELNVVTGRFSQAQAKISQVMTMAMFSTNSCDHDDAARDVTLALHAAGPRRRRQRPHQNCGVCSFLYRFHAVLANAIDAM
jgi:hypothetical protein